MDGVTGQSVELIIGHLADTSVHKHKKGKKGKSDRLDSFLGEGKHALEDPESTRPDGYHRFHKIQKQLPSTEPAAVPDTESSQPLPSNPTVEDIPDEEGLRDASHSRNQTDTIHITQPSASVPQYKSIYSKQPSASEPLPRAQPSRSRPARPAPPAPPAAASVSDIQESRPVKKRVSKELKQIVRRVSLKPVNYKDITQGFKITISLLDLLQISPDYAKNL